MGLVWGWALQVLIQIAIIFNEAALYILLGLFLAGIINLIFSMEMISKTLGRGNLKSSFLASLLGLPLPICSCGVMPLSVILRRKGASREGNLGFLISTPETGIDSIIITYGLLGPLMAVARPLVALFSAMLAGVISIVERVDKPEEVVEQDDQYCVDEGEESSYHVVGLRGFLRSIRQAFQKKSHFRGEEGAPEQGETPASKEAVPLRVLLADAGRFGFKKLLDELAIWFIIGIVVSGILAALVPENFMPAGLQGLPSMILAILVGIPLYMCAVESTPIAAVLIAKGISPGAALVFLLVGPATNMGTMILIRRFLGKRFLWVYLASVVAGALIGGICFDALLEATGWTVIPSLSPQGSILIVKLLASIVLLALLVASFKRSGVRSSLANARLGISGFFGSKGEERKEAAQGRNRRIGTRAALAIAALVVYGLSGFYTIQPGNAGFKKRLGRIVEREIDPGLHYRLPWPFESIDEFRVGMGRKTDIGYITDMKEIRVWKEQRDLRLRGTGWHSFFTTMHDDPERSIYLIGDENQLELKFSVHYRLKDSYAFFYEYAKDKDLVGLSAESVMREVLGSGQIDPVLTDRRHEIEQSVHGILQERLDRYGIGVEVLSINIVDLHPPQEAVEAFRNVSSAKEYRETLVHRAYGARNANLPKARGNAAKTVASAEAWADERVSRSRGEAEAYRTKVRAYKEYPEGTRARMYLETMERVLAGVNKFILPAGFVKGEIRYWQDEPVFHKKEDRGNR